MFRKWRSTEQSPTAKDSKRPTEPVPTSKESKLCSICRKEITGQVVRALDGCYHLDCFRCKDCNRVVAEKFFPLTGPDGPQILCEQDYFRRLDLLCAKCGGALRGEHINALNKKYHVDHFTCSLCPTVFRQKDSYYERDGEVYCQYHYSALFATKCAGCETPVLKNYVDMNTAKGVEQWHPECYMIFKVSLSVLDVGESTDLISAASFRSDHVLYLMLSDTQWNSSHMGVKLWNVKVASSKDGPGVPATVQPSTSTEDEMHKQQATMERVQRILQVLTAFEDSCANCTSDMLIHFLSHRYEDGALMARKVNRHMEALFTGLEEIQGQLRKPADRTILEQRNQAKHLAKKIVTFASLTSLALESPQAHEVTPKDIMRLVTSFARTLKLLIRAALNGALKSVKSRVIL
ncbi:hypothetical protein HK102_002698 [Quaeritorhiza haematococci]|nr:hypothetical protein HK102_002698 [Quaeritorhiza haematococci]